MEILNLKVTGMHCEGCSRALSASVRTLAGVHRVDAQADTGATTVTYDPQRARPEAIRKQIEAAGFEVLPA